MNQRHDALKAGCERVRSSANRCWINHIIDEAAANADLTINVEKAAPAEDWDRLFTGSIGVLLAYGDYNRHVKSFFTTRGISY